MDAELTQLVRDRVARCNEGDWAAVRDLTGAGFAYCEAGTGGRIDDVDDVIAALARLRSAAPESRIDVVRVLGDGPLTVAELVWSVTLGQRRLRLADRMWARWEDGKLAAEWHEAGVLALVGPLVERDLVAHRTGAAPIAPR